jgi:hypothetical protein
VKLTLHVENQDISHICQNCGTDIAGKFCHACGQRASLAYDRSLKSFIEHFFEELFVWDSRALRSIKYLLIRPGFLTHEYISGRVQSYISPLKLFLFTSLISFFIMIKADPDVYSSMVTESDNENDYIASFILEQESQSGESKELYIDNFNEQISGNITIYVFFIMVVFSVLLNLIYITKKIYYVEHLVFTLHFFTFVLICMFVGTFIDAIWDSAVVFFIYVIPAIYLFFALKTVYHKTIWKALLVCSFLTVNYWILVTVWIMGTMFISAMLA